MIAVIDYGAGNVASVANALSELKQEYIITNRENEILKSEKIIFPGQGEASFAVKQLHKLNLFTVLRLCKKPFLGICLGMQLMAAHSVEGNVAGLGIFPGNTQKFDASSVKVPHIGWNKVHIKKESRLFSGIPDEQFYFAHSFFLPPGEYTTAVTNHRLEFSASMERNNFFGVQFHPEKSGEAGMKLLENFISL